MKLSDVIFILGSVLIQTFMYKYINHNLFAAIVGFTVSAVAWFVWLRP